MALKIAIIIERADIRLGGAERSVLELRAALSALGHSVDVLAAKGQATGRNIHILCRSDAGKRMNFFTFGKTLREFLAENKYDIIHSVLPFEFADVYQPRGGTYAETIVRSAASYQNKFVEFYKKTFSVANSRRTTLLRAERKLAQASDGPVIAALSRYVAEQFREHYGTDSRRIAIIPNGIKIAKQHDTSQAYKLRTEILMQIASQKQKERKAYLIVAGRDKKKKYYHLANATAPRNIIFLGSLGNIHDAMSIIDIAVLPTFYDPSSRFILEALAAGKPVITTKYNGACDLFADNVHGKIVDDPQDASALAEAMVFFADTKNITNASQAIAQDNLQEKISISRAAKQLTELYASILEKKGIN
ncbi:MAG: glycosyltransferase family 4 protein [Sedimentisphaerales bacterium]